MTIEHVNITDPFIHEPKGASTATLNQVYVSDGSGSGSFKTVYMVGSEDDNHGGASQSLSTGPTKTYLLNDADGPFTTSLHRLPTKTDVWDTSNNEFDWLSAGYVLGDQVSLRLDIDITTTGANRVITTGLELATSGGTPVVFKLEDLIVKTASTISGHIVNAHFDLGDTNTLNNPAKFFMFSDGSGDTVQVNGWRVFVKPKNPIYN